MDPPAAAPGMEISQKQRWSSVTGVASGVSTPASAGQDRAATVSAGSNCHMT